MPRLPLVLRAAHPGPTAAVTVVAVLLGVGVGLDPLRVVGVGAVVLTNQLSVGLSNDALDAARDRAAGRRDKPVGSGDLGAASVLRLAVALAAASVLLAAALGIGVLLADVVFLAAGWLYNVVLKRTPLSLAAYLVGFAALPAVAVCALPGGLPAIWAMAAGALLGGAAHFGNVLPDIEADRAAGVRGLPQLLGRSASVVACFLFLAGAAVVIGAGLGWSALGLVVAGVTTALAVSGVAVGLSGAASRRLFQLVIVAALVDVAALVLAGGRLLA